MSLKLMFLLFMSNCLHINFIFWFKDSTIVVTNNYIKKLKSTNILITQQKHNIKPLCVIVIFISKLYLTWLLCRNSAKSELPDVNSAISYLNSCSKSNGNMPSAYMEISEKGGQETKVQNISF